MKEYEAMYRAWRADPPPTPPQSRRQKGGTESEAPTSRSRGLRSSLVMSVQQAGTYLDYHHRHNDDTTPSRLS